MHLVTVPIWHTEKFIESQAQQNQCFKSFRKYLRDYDWSNLLCNSTYWKTEITFKNKDLEGLNSLFFSLWIFWATGDLVILLLKLIAKSSIILVGSNPKENRVLWKYQTSYINIANVSYDNLDLVGFLIVAEYLSQGLFWSLWGEPESQM